MKFLRPSLILLPLLASFAQAQVTTDPVGFVTLTVAGNGGSGQPAYTFTSIGMTNAVAYQSTTTSPGGSTTLTDANSTWADNAYNGASGQITSYVEITSGAAAGTTYDITATTAGTHALTLSQPLSAGVAAGDSYKIRPHWTLASVFGATNQAGLSGGTSSTADTIQVFNNGGFVVYYYQTSGFGGTGWRQSGAPFVDASSTVLYPDEGILIARQQSSSVNITISGAVKTGQTSLPVSSGYTFLGNAYAAAMTLASSNLYTGDANTGLAGGTSSTADQVMFWNGTGYNVYYYQTSGFGGTGWRLSGAPFTDASTTSIPAGAALFVKRTGSAFNWVSPQTPASFN
ncbi:TIGR02597 family protein [Prosthecobacter sp.]|uniref:TIGR02597 family protein n=1 Tax=Prosthecobacter sp. TaxID=1965333 RepID=UPI003783A2AE